VERPLAVVGSGNSMAEAVAVAEASSVIAEDVKRLS
jgi:hypothetical protein